MILANDYSEASPLILLGSGLTARLFGPQQLLVVGATTGRSHGRHPRRRLATDGLRRLLHRLPRRRDDRQWSRDREQRTGRGRHRVYRPAPAMVRRVAGPSNDQLMPPRARSLSGRLLESRLLLDRALGEGLGFQALVGDPGTASTDRPYVPCAMRASGPNDRCKLVLEAGCHRLIDHLVLDLGAGFSSLARLVKPRRVVGLLLARSARQARPRPDGARAPQVLVHGAHP